MLLVYILFRWLEYTSLIELQRSSPLKFIIIVVSNRLILYRLILYPLIIITSENRQHNIRYITLPDQ